MRWNGEMSCLGEGSALNHESELTHKLIYVVIFGLRQTIIDDDFLGFTRVQLMKP